MGLGIISLPTSQAENELMRTDARSVSETGRAGAAKLCGSTGGTDRWCVCRGITIS
jgi:hypothetical protein